MEVLPWIHRKPLELICEANGRVLVALVYADSGANALPGAQVHTYTCKRTESTLVVKSHSVSAFKAGYSKNRQ